MKFKLLTLFVVGEIIFLLFGGLIPNFAEARDTTPPTVIAFHRPDPVLSSDTIALIVGAFDNSGIWLMGISWRINYGRWHLKYWIYPKSIFNYIQIGPYPQGTVVEYYGWAVDKKYNYKSTGIKKFTVFSADCYDRRRHYRGDLARCARGAGRCCGGICDTSYSCSLDNDCSIQVCKGTSWTCKPGRVGANCCPGSRKGNCDGCYRWENGCEMRDYYCTWWGTCSYSRSNRKKDKCSGSHFYDYGCKNNRCRLVRRINCAYNRNLDRDAIKCNCDCGCYDREEKLGVYCGGKDICNDGKDNDCDGLKDGEEPKCDTLPPVISVFTAYDKLGNEIPDGGVVERENASNIKFVSKDHFDEGSAIYYHKLEYRVKKPGQDFGSWQVLCACYDKNGDGYCDSSSIEGKCTADTSITDFEFSAGPFEGGDEVEYRVTLMDVRFHTSSSTKSFSVQNNPPNKPEISENPLENFGNVYPNSVECTSQKIYLVFKWKYTDPDGDKMKSARIQVSKNETFTDLLFDWKCNLSVKSGEETNLSTQNPSILDCYDQEGNPVKLSPEIEWGKKYWWRIKVQDEIGDWSEWQEVDTGGSSLVFNTPRHPYPLVDFTWIPFEPKTGESIKFNPQPPTGVSAAPFSGGNLAGGTYYYIITALFEKNGIFEETAPSKEVSCSVDGVSKKSCQISWNPVEGADRYRVYGRTSHSQSQYWEVVSTSFIDTGSGGTSGSPPSYPLCSCKTSTGKIRYFYCSTDPRDFPSECDPSITSITYKWDFRYKSLPGKDTSTEERPLYLGYFLPQEYSVHLEITQKESDGKEFKCSGEKSIHISQFILPSWKETKPE